MVSSGQRALIGGRPLSSADYINAQARRGEDSAPYIKDTSQNLALDGDLMFDQDDAPPRMKETLW